MPSKIEVMEKFNFMGFERAFQAALPELQYLRNRSLANLQQYFAHLCLTRISGGKGVKQADQKVWMPISLYPKILLDKKAQKLVIKLLLIQIFSPEY